MDAVEEFSREMFGIGHNDRSMFVRLEDTAGPIKECRCSLGNGLRRGPGREAYRRVRIGIEDKEDLSDLVGLGSIIPSMPAHLTFAVATHVMGINGQELVAEMP